jgi:allantoinase
MGPAQVAEWMSAVPAKLLGLDGRKGSIAAGKDADLVVWEPEGEQVVDVTRMHQRHKMTPYARRTLRGIVQATYLRGRRVYAAGAHVGAPSGSLLRRGRA